jgi:uncharacterized protein
MAKWDNLENSTNVEDRRGSTGKTVGGLGLVGIIIVLGVSLLGGNNPEVNQLAQDLATQISTQSTARQQVSTTEFDGLDSYEIFASKVLGSSDRLWSNYFAKSYGEYEKPKLVLFRNFTNSGCGVADSSVGPHYCPADNTIYLDETFFDELTSKLGAKGGDVAEAYVIAHEVGHHVQNQTGSLNDSVQSNDQSVATELQADCYAGVWANTVAAVGALEPAEISEALDAAAAVGDDRIQQNAGQKINRESWTHGSSEQRQAAFMTGYKDADPEACKIR